MPAMAVLLLALCAVGPDAARAQSLLAPSLTIDTAFTPPSGVARDNSPSTNTDVAWDVAVDGDRIYTVGESGGDVAIFARRTTGVPDTGFSDDGRLIIPVAPSTRRDFGVSIAVLPDHRLRVLVSANIVTTSTTDTDVAVIGLNQNGTPDLTFGSADSVVDGRVTFPVGTASADTPSRIAADATGRLAISGWTASAGRDNTFVALLAADGSPVAGFGTAGVKIIDRGLDAAVTKSDRGVDIGFRPGGGLAALLQVATSADGLGSWVPVLHAFTETGADDTHFAGDGDLPLAVGEPNTTPVGGLRVFAGRLWVTGGTRVGTDIDSFLARVEADGSGFQSRRFDMRGPIAQTQAVLSRGFDLDVVPGTPNTLVVVGSVELTSQSQPRPYWGAAAFNGLEGPLASAGYDDALIVTDENAELSSVAAGNGWVATSAWLRTTSGVIESSMGTARLLIDAEKRCDLAVDVPSPLEVEFDGNRSATITVRVTNVGTKACSGVVSVPAPYALRLGSLTGGLPTGVLLPGASYTAPTATLTYAGARRAEDILRVLVRSSGDVNGENNTALVGVVFSYCDVRLDRGGASGLAPSEGSRTFEFSIRNAGTVPCRRARITTGAGVRSRRTTESITLGGGRSVSEEISAAPAGPRQVGRRVRMAFRALADADVDNANDSTTISPMIIGVGDTNARRPGSRAKRLSGRASGGRGPIGRRSRRITGVHVAVRRLGGRCRWLASKGGRLRSGRGRRCNRPVWLRAKGTRRWSLALDSRLPRGSYVLYSRATIAAGGFREASFTARDRNRIVFRSR